VEANRELGFPDDAREYQAVPTVLGLLGIRSIRLITNNPMKIATLRGLGVVITNRIPIHVEPNPHSVGYISTKQSRMGHHAT